MVFVGWIEVDEEVAVEFEVPFMAVVVDRVEPWSSNCDEVEVRVEDDSVPLLVTLIPIPKTIVVPRVVVLVVDPLLIVETMVEVDMAEYVVVVGIVMVDP